jgi:hypothetical protein
MKMKKKIWINFDHRAARIDAGLRRVGDCAGRRDRLRLRRAVGIAQVRVNTPRLRQVAELAAREGIETYEARGRPWPCGTHGGMPDPSLIVGEAGIGAFYLCLADPETP